MAAPAPKLGRLVRAGVTYVASCHTDVGHYSSEDNYFTRAITNGPLTAPADGGTGNPNGVYALGSTVTFPKTGYAASNYWVDVVFTAS